MRWQSNNLQQWTKWCDKTIFSRRRFLIENLAFNCINVCYSCAFLPLRFASLHHHYVVYGSIIVSCQYGNKSVDLTLCVHSSMKQKRVVGRCASSLVRIENQKQLLLFAFDATTHFNTFSNISLTRRFLLASFSLRSEHTFQFAHSIVAHSFSVSYRLRPPRPNTMNLVVFVVSCSLRFLFLQFCKCAKFTLLIRSLYLQFRMSDMKTARPRIPSPRTGAILLVFFLFLLLFIILYLSQNQQHYSQCRYLVHWLNTPISCTQIIHSTIK